MKRTFIAACCTVLIAGFAVAQEAAPAVAPAAEVVAAAAEAATTIPAAAAPGTQEAAPAAVVVQEAVAAPAAVVQEAAVTEVATPATDIVAPAASVLNEGLIIESAPITQGQVEMAPMAYDQGIGNSVVVAAPAVQSLQSVPAPVYSNTPVAVAVDPFAVQAQPCVNCQPTRRGVVRTVTTRGRSMFTRVRGVFGRRR